MDNTYFIVLAVSSLVPRLATAPPALAPPPPEALLLLSRVLGEHALRRVRRAVAVFAHPRLVTGALVIGRHPVCHFALARSVSGAYLVARSPRTLKEEINVCAVGIGERQTVSFG